KSMRSRRLGFENRLARAPNQRKGLDGNLQGEERLSQQVLATAQGGFGPGIKVAVPGNKHYWSSRIAGRFANPLTEFKSIHAGHFHVQKNGVVGLFCDQGQTRLRIGGKVRSIKNLLERGGDGEATDAVIIHHQEFGRRLVSSVELESIGAEIVQQVHSTGNG